MNYDSLQKLSYLKRDITYKNKPGIRMDKFSNRLGSIEQDPFIGFVGKDFEQTQTKVLFLGKSNAESKSEHQAIDRQINQALLCFKSSEKNKEIFYRQYANRYLEAMPRWNISRFVNEFRNLTKLSLHQIAYANIVPYRYIGAPNNAAYKIAFENFTNQFIEITKPDLIVPLGANLEEIIIRNLITDRNIYVTKGINREGRDKRIAEVGWQTILNAVEDYENKQRG